MNYFDILLAKKLEDDRDPKVEGLSVTQNGRYHEDGVVYDPVIVNVQPDLITKSITANGTYTASSDNADGYSSVNVNVSGYKISDVSGLPSPIATFSDGANLPMPKLKVSVEPVQEGSGDPSPENIRPISGWSAVDVNVCGVNVWDEEWELGGYSASTGNKTSSTSSICAKNKIAIMPNTSYYCNFTTGAMNVICFYDKSGTFIANSAIGISGKSVITTPNNAYFMAFQMSATYGTTYNHDISINYPSTDTEYHAYNGSTITIQLGSTYYGGTLDVVSGVLTVDRGYIASYNGETLPSTWISDRDVYAEGTTPTIGAEVVYELATPTTIQLTPTAVKSLLGTNNLWADTGDVTEASYWEEL